MEDGVKGKCLVQSERDEAIFRAKRTSKQAEKTTHQLMEAKAQLAEMKAQLVDAADHKIAALERGRKLDDLQGRIAELENEKSRLLSQLSTFKSRCRTTIDTSVERGRRDEHVIHVNIPLFLSTYSYLSIMIISISGTARRYRSSEKPISRNQSQIVTITNI